MNGALRGALLLAVLLAAPVCAEGPQRVLSAGAHVTEIIYALGAEDRLVGADSQSIYPPAAQQLPQIGYVRQISVEGVAALEPELLLAGHDLGPASAVAQLRTLGIELVQTGPAQSIEETAERIRVVGEALGMPDDGRLLADRVAARAQRISAHYRALPQPPRAALFLGRGAGSGTGAGRDSAGDAMIRLAGGINALDGMSGFKPVSAEALVAAAPEVVVLTTHMVDAAGSLEQAIDAVPGLRDTPAAQSGRVVALDIVELFSFGPRLPEAIARLGAAFHPQHPVADPH
ncbi:hemin ABC transporter substrate-binding protein [Pseudothauera nasutitermitis]|uniref:Hemin ABC transporter substrate-binding protein n=1 Tax=Pseudothauera nasutitermitis TaxID=2565930 RepID=A0A4S4AMZ9_9RHOO|nr:ABC transporter substrate-binding protein [Pseudothauera nasutitermitis]THF60570.1 hemin ABC transporter substrate-binding protein [Pseudothauera nasutitermitis]